MMANRFALTLVALSMACVVTAQPAADTQALPNGGNWGNPPANGVQNPWQNGRRWPAQGRRWPSPWGWQRSGGNGSPANQPAWGQQSKIEGGFVFVDGKDVQPPFEISRKDGKICINDLAVCESLSKEEAQKRMDGIPWGAMGEGPLVTEIRTNLCDGGMVLVANGSHYVLPAETTVDALTILASDRSRKSKLKKLAKLSEENEADIPWETVVDAFQPTVGLEDRIDQTARMLNASSGSFRRSRRILLVSGLVLAILALGCLVLYRPASHGESRAPALLTRTVIVSIALLLAMNVYDLVATMHSCVPGALLEVNWLAQPLIRKPFLIAVGKLGAVGLGCFAIWWFRERKIASFAAWWLGLAYTVLTFHWAICQYILLV